MSPRHEKALLLRLLGSYVLVGGYNNKRKKNAKKMKGEGMIIAVDFDGTLCGNMFPDIGVANFELIVALRALKESTDCTLILWTCRVGDRLREAVDWCDSYGLHFDEVNNNHSKNVDDFGTNPRKVFADMYIDDKSIGYTHRKAVEYIKSLIKEDDYD